MMNNRFLNCVLAMFAGFLLCTTGCDQRAEGDARASRPASANATDAADAAPATPSAPAPALTASQITLLDLAFTSAGKIPVDPHHKDRAKAQSWVVAAALELGDLERAILYARAIDNWRQGIAFADIAMALARKDQNDRAEELLTLAARHITVTEEWRADAIKAKMAQAYTLLGQHDKATELQKNVANAEAGKVDTVLAATLKDEQFDAQIATLEAAVQTNDFDLTRNAIATYIELYRRFYSDSNRRDLVRKRVSESWTRLPILIRVQFVADLASVAVEHKDVATATELIDEAHRMIESAKWSIDDRVPLLARLLVLRHRAGDTERARTEAHLALEAYTAARTTIADIYRAATIRPLAKALHTIGDVEGAMSLFAQAIEEGAANPNARPRAEDLAATCCAIAVCGLDPDASMLARVREIHEQLRHPW